MLINMFESAIETYGFNLAPVSGGSKNEVDIPFDFFSEVGGRWLFSDEVISAIGPSTTDSLLFPISFSFLT